MEKQFFAGSIGKLISLSLTALILFSAIGAVEAHPPNERHPANMNNSGQQSTITVEAPKIEWEKTFVNHLFYDRPVAQQTSDGGYIVAGMIENKNAPPTFPITKIYLVKTDAKGNKIWYREFGTSKYSLGVYGECVQQTKDSGFIIVGTISYAPTFLKNCDIYLLKTDANGNQQWDQTFHITDENWGRSVQQTTDGGYIIVGKATSDSTNVSPIDNGFLIKTDAKGNKIWESIVDIHYRSECNSVQQTQDGGYIVTGIGMLTWSGGPGRILLFKTDANGNEQWERDFGSDGRGSSVKQTADGGYIVTGIDHKRGMGDIYLLRTDVNGVLQWEKHFGGIGNGFSVQQTKDAGYLVAGCIQTNHSNYTTMCLLKTNIKGDKIWEKTLRDGECYSVQQTVDDGYIVAGQIWRSFPNVETYLAKLSPESPYIPL